MYVDESGDTGIEGSRSRYFILSAIVIHESLWNEALSSVKDFRRTLYQSYGIRQRVELHASPLLSKKHKGWDHLNPWDRSQAYKSFVQFIGSQSHARIMSVCVDKNSSKYTKSETVFQDAWSFLLQRFNTTLLKRNFPSGFSAHSISITDSGIVIPDLSAPLTINRIMRRMRVYNSVPTSGLAGPAKNLPITHVVEDPMHKDSANSLFIQMADFVAHSVKSKVLPSGAAKKYGVKNYYDNYLRQIAATVISPTNDGIKYV